ncbi:acyltransferase family protein [Lacrimispora sphenoides]|jgi:fucose 4-O-acetylase-like acetyltransferase|uniref:acyltransferase family protein n=1 Tax=Lacrimispora sphenoides TaxID=29370 RepID=UPI000B8650A6|nr:acyltransferase family protein [Lacrimispora sphenoides]
MIESRRLSYIDIAKGIGMICVILGHMEIDKINTIVFSFHMPLFYIINGYFIKKSDYSVFILKKAKTLLVPYLFTGLCIVVFEVFKDLCRCIYDRIPFDISSWIYAILYGSGSNYSSPFFIKSIGALWFLLALFLAFIIYNYIIDKKYFWIYVFFLLWGI